MNFLACTAEELPKAINSLFESNPLDPSSYVVQIVSVIPTIYRVNLLSDTSFIATEFLIVYLKQRVGGPLMNAARKG